MFKKSVFTLLVILMIPIFTGIVVGEEKTTGFCRLFIKAANAG